MNEENNNPPNVNSDPQSDNQDTDVAPPLRSGGERVIQPSETIKQELQAPQQVQLQVAHPTAPTTPNPQPNPTLNPTSVYPEPTSGQIQVGMSASQLGLHEPKSKLFDFNPKQLIIKGLVGLVIVGGIFTALVMTNIITLSEFKTLSYTSSGGTHYKLDFYTKHSSKQLKSGNTMLVSKVSKYGKYPVALSIHTGDSSALNINGIKTCSGPWPKAMDVQNNNINQTIAVCYMPLSQKDAPVGVYVAGFEYNNQAHIVTIAQDLGDFDVSSQSGAKDFLTKFDLSSQSGAIDFLTKFGIEPYKADIERIVSSIKVE